MRQRRSPKRNVDAPTFVAWLDSQAVYAVDLDSVRRVYINNIWVDPTLKRELRRYRNGQVKTLRPEVAAHIANTFNLSMEDFQHGSS